MTNFENDILIPIKAPSLTSEEYGKDISEVFDNIAKNFQTIVSLDYIKGAQGDSIITKTAKLNEFSDIDITKSWGQCIEDIIKYEFDNDSLIPITYDNEKITCFKYLYNELGNFRDDIYLTLIYKKDNNSEIEELVSSLPFIFLDERFNHKVLSLADSVQYNGLEDCSCILNIEDGQFKILRTYPTLYYDINIGNFCWKINSAETGLIARGPQGEVGRTSKCHVIKCTDDISDSKVIYKNIQIRDTNNNWVNIDKDNAYQFDIVNGDLVFILSHKDKSNSMSPCDFYISNIWFDDADDDYYTIISGNSIYSEFLTENFKSFLSNINITSSSDDFLRGLYIPMCPGNSDKTDYVHIMCATPTTSESTGNDIFSDNINFNVIPTTSLKDVNNGSVKVKRAAVIYQKGMDKVDENNHYTIKYVSKYTDFDALTATLRLSESNMISGLRLIFGKPANLSNEDEDYATDIQIKQMVSNNPIYVWVNNANKYYISNELNLYDNPDICICAFDNSTQKFIDFGVFENDSYLLNTTITDDYKNNTSLNFGYNNVYFGTKRDEDEDADVNVNINGNLHVSNLYGNEVQINNMNAHDISVENDITCDKLSSNTNITTTSMITNNITVNKADINNLNGKTINTVDITSDNINSSDLILSKQLSVCGSSTLINEDGISTEKATILNGGNFYNFFASYNAKDDNNTTSSQFVKTKLSKSYDSWASDYWKHSFTHDNLYRNYIFLDIDAERDYGVSYFKFDENEIDTNPPIYAIYSSYIYRRTIWTGTSPNFGQSTGTIIIEITTYTDSKKHTFESVYEGRSESYWGNRWENYYSRLKSYFKKDVIESMKILLKKKLKKITIKQGSPAYFSGWGNDNKEVACGPCELVIGPMKSNYNPGAGVSSFKDIINDQPVSWTITYPNKNYTAGDTTGYPKLFLNSDSFIIKFGADQNAKIEFKLDNDKPTMIMAGQFKFTGERYNDGEE